MTDRARIWRDAVLVAQLFALDPVGTGGVVVRAHAGPVRERWMGLLRALLPAATPWRKVPVQVSEERLLGGLDLAATLRGGRPIAERGLLAEADSGVLILAMAERTAPVTAAHLTSALDLGMVRAERDGLTLRHTSRLGIVALDEGGDDERLPEPLADRLAFRLDLADLPLGLAAAEAIEPLASARAALPAVEMPAPILAALCAAAAALGIRSLRAPLLAVRVARAAAALRGEPAVSEHEAAIAARLVLAPRATTLPAEPGKDEAEAQPSAPEDEAADRATPAPDAALEDVVLAAALAAMPADLLARLRQPDATRARTTGRTGSEQRRARRGRPAGVRRAGSRSTARLSLIDTLRSAAPWQKLRRAARGSNGRIEVRPDDLRVRHFKHRSQTTTLFVVDASGSAALHRLAEAKGAVELLLAECYVRRDRVALLAFRGRAADLILPPTRSLVRARRCLAGLPGGGGTPLAAGIDAAVSLADAIRRHGDTPVVVFLTDGRANIARDGSAGRARAGDDARAAARTLGAASIRAVLVDTSPRPQPAARELADAMRALYLPLPYADAAALSRAIAASTAPAAARAA